MKNTFNENVLFYAHAHTPVQGLYRHIKKFRFGYFVAFFFTFLINLAYILGLWLQVDAGNTASAQDNLWFCLVFTLLLATGALLVLIKRLPAALAVNCLSAVTMLVGIWGNMFMVEPADGLAAADGILYSAPVALLLLILCSVLHFTAWYLRKKQVQRTYNRIVTAIYSRIAREQEGTVAEAALQAALDAYSGEDIKTFSGKRLTRSEKARLRKHK